MSKFCSNCGNALPDDAMFCGNCGSAVSNAQPAEPVTPPVQPETPVYTAPAQPEAPVYTAPVQPDPAPYGGEVPYTPYTYADPAPQPPAKQTLMQKVKSFSLKIWLIIAAAVVVLGVGIWLVVGLLTNTYETPVKLYVEQMNNQKFSWDNLTDSMNGFADSEVQAIFDILKKSERFDSLEESFDEQVAAYEKKYGDDYKFSYKIEDKEKLDKDDLEEFEEDLNNQGKNLINSMDQVADADQWDMIASAMGLTTAQAKKLIKAMEAFGKVLKKADVSEGYELTVTIITKGSELDEPEEKEMTMYVYKVDGRWISGSAITDLDFPLG